MRQRMVKPELFSNERVSSISIPARFLFVGLLTFADDAGNMDASAKQAKNRVFPGDDLTESTVAEMIEELVSVGLFSRYTSNGRLYLHICGFSEHQKLDHPTRPCHPLAPGQVYRYQVKDGTAWKWVEVSWVPEHSPTVPEHSPTHEQQSANVRVNSVKVVKVVEGKVLTPPLPPTTPPSEAQSVTAPASATDGLAELLDTTERTTKPTELHDDTSNDPPRPNLDGLAPDDAIEKANAHLHAVRRARGIEKPPEGNA